MRALLLGVCALTACTSVPDPGAEPPPDASVELDAALDAPPSVRGELRGVWITRFAYTTQAQLEQIIDRAADAHLNAVFVQIRGEGDAYYRSSLEPWARRLTGTLGRDPGWDPLQVAIDRAHLHGLELHAYFNVFSAWSTATTIPQAEGPVQHALYDHPAWLAVTSSGMNADTEYRWFSPGIPAVRAHITAVATELLARYAVDGLHLDRIRTPGPDYSRDPITTAAFDAARMQDPSLTWATFMRTQVNAMVAELYAAIAATRPSVRLSAAVWGIHTAMPGCATSAGNRDYYQDSVAWLEAGIIDAIVPMMYWSMDPGACTDWAALLDGFVARRAGRQIWGGMHALDASAWNLPQVTARVERSRLVDAHGAVIYASSYLDADPARWRDLIGTPSDPGVYHDRAPTPAMSWK